MPVNWMCIFTSMLECTACLELSLYWWFLPRKLDHQLSNAASRMR